MQNYIIAARVTQGYEDLKVSTPEERYDIVARWQALHTEAASKKAKPPSFQSNASKTDSRSRSESPAAAFSAGESEDKVFDDAIKESVAVTSTGNPEEDEWIARAIKASVAELRRSTKEENGDAAMQRAIDASLAEADRARSETQAHPSAQGSHEAGSDNKAAMHQSESQPYVHGSTDDAGVDTDDDENVKRALEQSKQDSRKDRADSNDDLSKALAESLKGSTEADLARSKADEEERVVLEYVKRQSALEEQHRRNAGT